MSAYVVSVRTDSALIVRTVDFDGEHVTAARNLRDEPVELAAPFRTFVEALLVAHEDGHAGEYVAIDVSPAVVP